jgi:hypothetical protein
MVAFFTGFREHYWMTLVDALGGVDQWSSFDWALKNM